MLQQVIQDQSGSGAAGSTPSQLPAQPNLQGIPSPPTAVPNVAPPFPQATDSRFAQPSQANQLRCSIVEVRVCSPASCHSTRCNDPWSVSFSSSQAAGIPSTGRTSLSLAGVFGAGKTTSVTFVLMWLALTTPPNVEMVVKIRRVRRLPNCSRNIHTTKNTKVSLHTASKQCTFHELCSPKLSKILRNTKFRQNTYEKLQTCVVMEKPQTWSCCSANRLQLDVP